MSVAASIFSVVFFVLILTIIISTEKSDLPPAYDHATDYAPQWESIRSKRSPNNDMPHSLKLRVKYMNEMEIDLEWIKTEKYLANEHLPVITVFGNPIPNVMKNIGEFVIYHDVNKCSSVIYYDKLKAFFGNIGMEYYITNLPYKFDENGYFVGIAKAPFIMKRDGHLEHNRFSLPKAKVYSPSADRPLCILKRPSDSEAGSSKKYHRSKREFAGEKYEKEPYINGSQTKHIRARRWKPLMQEYYLETLIFITRDVVEIFKKGYGMDEYISSIVRYCLNNFNVVDMLFQKRSTKNFKIRINIAKIIIEDISHGIDPMNPAEPQFAETIMRLRKYLFAYRDIFTPDSFDHVFMITSSPIKDGSNFIVGKTQYGIDMYKARQNDQFYNAVPITMLSYLTDYVIAVQEISLTFNIKIELSTENIIHGVQCSSIMQQSSSKCDHCLQWSFKSKNQFREFFSTNRNRCFLLNKPRSLRPIGPSPNVTPLRQCQCFGYTSYERPHVSGKVQNYIPSHKCQSPLQCSRSKTGKSSLEGTIRPFDGTRCGYFKVCWEGQCVDLPFSLRDN